MYLDWNDAEKRHMEEVSFVVAAILTLVMLIGGFFIAL